MSPSDWTGQQPNNEGPDTHASQAWQQESARDWAGHQLKALSALADEHKQAMHLTGLALLAGANPATDRDGQISTSRLCACPGWSGAGWHM